MLETAPILLVEDDKIDAKTIMRALQEIHIINPIIIAQNGVEALEYLNDSTKKKPGIILLDINMPKMNGIEFLKIAKNDIDLRVIPIVVLTTSQHEQDKVESYNLGVSGYMIKPVDYLKFVEVVKTIHLYWTLSELPGEKR